MAHKWQQDARGKTLMLVGPTLGRLQPFDIAERLGIHLIVVHFSDSWILQYPPQYTLKDFIVVEKDIPAKQQSEEVVRKVREKKLHVDGVITTSEYWIPCAHLISSLLGINPNQADAFEAARDKSVLRRRTKEKGLPTPPFSVIQSSLDIPQAIKSVPFPAVLKLVDRAGSYGVVKVDSDEELSEKYNAAAALIQKNSLPVFAKTEEITKVLLEGFLDGPEVDVDLLILKGNLLFASVSDNGTLSSDSMLQESWNLPSRLAHEKKASLVKLCYNTVKTLGYKNGVFHVEAKYSESLGPQIVELNARPGGGYVCAALKSVWGIDFYEQLMLITIHGSPTSTSNVSPPENLFPSPVLSFGSSVPVPKLYISGRYLFPTKTGTLESIENLMKLTTEDPTVHSVTIGKATPCTVVSPATTYEECIGIIETWGNDWEEAEERMRSTLANLHFLIR